MSLFTVLVFLTVTRHNNIKDQTVEMSQMGFECQLHSIFHVFIDPVTINTPRCLVQSLWIFPEIFPPNVCCHSLLVEFDKK